MYGKIFDSIYDGTLVEDWRALITFQQMIVLCDADGIIDMTPSAISRRTSIPIEHIKAGIEILEKPDEWSRTPDEDGCRIKRLDDHKPWGWYLVNHNKYKSLQDADTVREQNRIRKQRQRERDKQSRNVTDGHGQSRHTDIDTNTNKEIHIPDWVDSDLWNEWLDIRKKIKAKNTARAKQLLINSLTKIKEAGYDPNQAIEKAIQSSWKSIELTWIEKILDKDNIDEIHYQ